MNALPYHNYTAAVFIPYDKAIKVTSGIANYKAKDLYYYSMELKNFAIPTLPVVLLLLIGGVTQIQTKHIAYAWDEGGGGLGGYNPDGGGLLGVWHHITNALGLGGYDGGGGGLTGPGGGYYPVGYHSSYYNGFQARQSQATSDYNGGLGYYSHCDCW